jgi:hypothetical protein
MRISPKVYNSMHKQFSGLQHRQNPSDSTCACKIETEIYFLEIKKPKAFQNYLSLSQVQMNVIDLEKIARSK